MIQKIRGIPEMNRPNESIPWIESDFPAPISVTKDGWEKPCLYMQCCAAYGSAWLFYTVTELNLLHVMCKSLTHSVLYHRHDCSFTLNCNRQPCIILITPACSFLMTQTNTAEVNLIRNRNSHSKGYMDNRCRQLQLQETHYIACSILQALFWPALFVLQIEINLWKQNDYIKILNEIKFL